MLYYWIHVLLIFIYARCFSKKVAVDSSITRKRRVTIFDCEGFRYMSNTRYISYMDFIRFELTFRSNLYDNTVKKGMTPILASQKVIYKRPLKLGDLFTITLNNEGWDDKWVYHSHTFKIKEIVYAIGYTKVAFWRNKKVQNMTEIIKNCGVENIKKEPENKILDIFNNDSNLLKITP